MILKRRETSRAESWFVYLGIAVLTSFFLFPFVRVLWRIGDEGTLVYGAHRVLQGQIPGRDFFEPMGPGSFYWLAAFFRVFGESIGTARAVVLLTGVALNLLTLYCSRRISVPAAVPVLLTTVLCIPLWPVTSHHWDSNLFALSAFAVFLVWQHSRRSAALLICGILSGICFCILQPKGLLMCAGFVVSVCLLERKERLRFVAVLLLSFASIPAMICGFYFWYGALSDLIQSNIVWPAQHYGAVNKVPYAFGLFRTLGAYYSGFEQSLGRPEAFILSGLITTPLVIVACLPGLLAAAALVLRRKAFSTDLLPFWVSGAALWLSEMKHPDMAHILFGSLIWLILLCALLRHLPRARLFSTAVAVALGFFGVENLGIALQASTRVETRRGVLYAAQPERALSSLIAHTTRGEPTLIYPYCPLYYFLSGTENATRLSIFVYGYNTPDEFRSATQNLQKKRVRFVLSDTRVSGMNLVKWLPQYRQPSNDGLIMENYLDSQYHQIAFEDGFRVLERNGEKQ